MYCCKTSKTGYSFRKFSLRDIIRLSGTVFYTFQRVRVKVWNFNLIFYNSEPICMRSFSVSGHLSAFIPSGWFTNLKASAVGIMVPTSHRGMYLISPAPRLLRWKLAVDIIRYKLCGHPITGHIRLHSQSGWGLWLWWQRKTTSRDKLFSPTALSGV